MTGDDRPGLSVVIAASDSASAVDRLLRSIAEQDQGRAEVIVIGEAPMARGRAPLAPPRPPLPGPLPRGEREQFCRHTSSIAIEEFFPPLPSRERAVGRGRVAPANPSSHPRSLRIVATTGSGVPRLRRLGLEAAAGRVVVFTEDSCVAAPGWLDAWTATFDDPSVAAASGVVEHDAGASAIDWAVVFCEYAPFLPPSPPGPPARLAGNNFAVDRELALRLSGDEVHETALLAAILREGRPVRTADRAVVRHVRRFGLREALGDRLRFGLEFGRLRARDLSPIARHAGWVAGPAIFAAQAGRLGLTVLRNGRHLAAFRKSLPVTLAMLAAWSLGEWAGWSLGSISGGIPGSSDSRHEGRRGPSPGLRPPSPKGRGASPAPSPPGGFAQKPPDAQ